MTGASAYDGVRSAAIGRAAVVGMGAMGTGIAQAILMAGLPVVAVDENPGALAKGPQRIRGSLEKRVAQGKLDRPHCDRLLASLTATRDLEAIRDADLIIEAVFEDLETKRRVLVQIESHCRDDAILATNTSTINLDQLADGLRHPQRLLGMHFFNPAHHMPLVEVIRRDAAPPGPVATVMRFAEQIGKRPVLVRNRAGFLVNRIFVPYLKEACFLLEEGAGAAEVDAAMVEFGFPMGPLAVCDLAGLDILVSAHRVMSRVFPHLGSTWAIAERLAEGGHLGQKSGSGLYRYEPGDTTPHPSGVAQEIIAGVKREFGRAPRRVDRQEIARRLVLRMVAEAFRLMEESVAQSESDVDAAMVLGVGFPAVRGGPVKYARGFGLDAVLAQLRDLSVQCGPRYEPCDFLTTRLSN
jgi:3-hydroxyacyl-CoA dehydrogenase